MRLGTARRFLGVQCIRVMCQHVDCLVIGGGIHGVGVAQAAAAAGYSTWVLEQAELAAGTSSRSSKLIHGGLRYLEQGHVGLVRESLRERQRLLRLAPSLVKMVPFYIPVYGHALRRPWWIRSGLATYAALTGFSRYSRFRSVPRDEWDDLDGLTLEGLRVVFQYWDAQTDDRQLTRAVMESARSLGARLLCPARFVHGTLVPDGCRATFEHAGGQQTVLARVTINAGGPWASGVLERFEPPIPAPRVENVQGSHIELPGRLRRGCYYLEAADRRAVFAMPWKDRTLVGTTEIVYRGDPADTRPTDEEIRYLLDVYRRYFPGRPTDVLSAWSGLRVLPAGGAAFSRSRETQLVTDRPVRPRVVTILGGKLTGYRSTASRVIRHILPSLPPSHPKAQTARLTLSIPSPDEQRT